MVAGRTKKTKHDMFGRPAKATPASPSLFHLLPIAIALVTVSTKEFEHASGFWGNQSNFGLAGPLGRRGNLVADFWTKWWRPWALLGILIVVLALVLIITAVT